MAHGPAPPAAVQIGPTIEAPEQIHSGQLAVPPSLMVEEDDRAQAEQEAQLQALREHTLYMLPGRR